MRILSVIGTRPEVIKMAMVARALGSTDGVEHRICATAQHREMLDSALQSFNLRSDFDFGVMVPDQNLTHITDTVLNGMATVLSQMQPDRVLVQGDTTTTLAAALAAFYAKTPVGHVEAGLRSGRVSMPWPEEMNRRLTDAISDRHFVPTNKARENLLAEGIPDGGICVTGNTVVDALQYMVRRLDDDPELRMRARAALPATDPDRRLVLVTGHRRENIGFGLSQVCEAIARIAARDDVEIVFPVHPNPRVHGPVHAALGAHPHIHLIQPLEYIPFVHLMNESYFIITDSGGIQEEAPSLGKPVLVTREVTERPEAVDAGTVRLVGTDLDRIVDEAFRLLDNPQAYESMAWIHNPYGDGRASERIVSLLLRG